MKVMERSDEEKHETVKQSCKSPFIDATTSSLSLVWTDVSYRISRLRLTGEYPFYATLEKTILSKCSGSAESATITGIVGPSGAGKSSLLQILAGRKETGVTGEVEVRHDSPNKRIIKVTFMGQNDDFSPNLTVRETLEFAYKLMSHEQKKYGKSHCPSSVADILHDLMLTCCADVRVSKCSGGQVKRLSIACELIAPPDIMILDEPSSGLDSNCALQVIQLLKGLAVEKNIAIIASIHQPNSKIVSVFDNLYVLSHHGRNIFAGPSNSLSDILQMNGVECPVYFNPVDIVLDIAAGQHSHQVLSSMISARETVTSADNETNNNAMYTHKTSMKKIFERMMTRSLPFFSHTIILFHRSFILSLREPLVFFLSFLQHISVALVAGSVYTKSTGAYDGCYKEQFINPLFFNHNTTDTMMMENIQTFSGVTVIVVNTLFLFLATVSSTALTFPLEVKVFMKEKTNRWYSCLSYYMGRTLADAPFRVIFPIMYSLLIYQLTGQVRQVDRVVLFSLINVSFAFMAQANGIFFSSIFIHSISAAAVNGCVSLTPFLLLGGFIVSVKSMPPWAQFLSTFSYFRYTFEASASVLFGMDRCAHTSNASEQLLFTPYHDLHNSLQSHNLSYNNMFKLFKRYLSAQEFGEASEGEIISKIRIASNTTKQIFFQLEAGRYLGRSFILDIFDIPEYYVWTPLAVLVAYFCVFRLLAYVILLYRSTPKK